VTSIRAKVPDLPHPSLHTKTVGFLELRDLKKATFKMILN